jgi:hypothetical protein
LLLGEGESQRGGRRRPALLASAFEAVVGAIYLDLGFESASAFVVGVANPELTRERPLNSLKSPKSRLQEFTQRLSGDRPQYRLVQAIGPDHDKVFRVEVAVEGRVIGTGEGHSRRLAESAAAAGAIDALRQEPGFFADQAKGAPELSEPAEGLLDSDYEERPETVTPERRLAEWEAAMREPEVSRRTAEAEAGSDGSVSGDGLR